MARFSWRGRPILTIPLLPCGPLPLQRNKVCDWHRRHFSGCHWPRQIFRFRGREMVHADLGMQVLNRVRGEMDAVTKIESMPRMEGRQMVMVLAPK